MVVVSVTPILVAAYLSINNVAVAHKTDVARSEDGAIGQKEAEIEKYASQAMIPTIYFSGNATSERAIYAGEPICKNARTETDFEKCVGDARKLTFAQFFSTNKAVVELTAIALDGRETVRIDSNNPNGVPDSELRDLSQDPAFLSAKKGGYYVGPVTFTPDGPEVFTASLVTNGEGYPLEVAMAKVKMSGVRDILQHAALGNTGYLYLVDSKGFVIGGGENGPPYQSNLQKTGIVSSVLGGQNFSGAEGQRRYKNFSGEDVVAAGKLLPNYGWGLIAEWPASEADAIVGELTRRSAVISVIVFLAVIFASILLSILIVRPIRILEKGTELVARGKFDEQVKIGTGDELEELGQAFNKMMAGLKQLQELKDEFVFIAAHELRTPVAAMKGYLTLVRDGATGPILEKTKEFVIKVINANQRLIQLVNDLLEVARSEAGHLTIKVAPVDITESVGAALGELKPLADEKKMELRHEIPANLPKALADQDRVKEVMVNLAGNAIRYNNEGGHVWVTHEVKDKELITRVNDDGFGISKEAQAKLFEKFYRVQTEKTRDITGTGLGLFIVKEIIEKMNGKIFVESEEGKGSTFGFSLPIAIS